MKKIMLLLLLQLMTAAITAQKLRYDTIPGYIVTLGNDTVYGHFQFTIKGSSYNAEDWYKRVFFIDSTGQKHKYESSDISAYTFMLDSLREFTFRAKDIPIPNKAGLFKGEGHKFVMVEADGPVCLYRYFHEEVSLGFYGWYNERYLQKSGEPVILLKRNNMTQKYKLSVDKAWFEGFPDLEDYYDKELDAKHLAELMLAYNTWKQHKQ